MITDYNGVKFYGGNDLSAGHYLSIAEDILVGLDIEKECQGINQAIELYNITQYLDRNLRLTSWNDTMYTEFQEKAKAFPKLISMFFSKINGKTLADHYSQLDFQYANDFWQLICTYKVYERIDKLDISKILFQDNTTLCYILHQKKLVSYYGQEIADYMKTADESAELILDQFLAIRGDTSLDYFFPYELNPKDRIEILNKYIKSDDVNPNYLKLLENASKIPELPVDDRLRLAAKNKYEEYWSRKTFTGSGIEFGAEIAFASIAEESKKEEYKNNIFYGTYSKEWVKQNLDYPTLLNNFIYLFGYTDMWFRCSFVSTPSKMSELEKVLGIRGKDDYMTGSHFALQRITTCLQMQAYRRELERNGINLESIFQWFFETYIVDEFNVKGFTYKAPSEYTTTFEKCKLLASAIDGVLKQYHLFCEDGYVNRELLEISSNHIAFSSLASAQEKKYAYSNSEELKREQFLLYSDQSMLHYTKKTKSNYNTFAQMVLGESMILDDFEHYQKPYIEWLIKRGTITIKEHSILSIDIQRAFILGELYENDVICPLYCGELKSLLDEMHFVGDIRYENTLFSKPEQDYLNYMLNKSEFRNGYDLRNKYIHDTHSLDHDIQEADYLELLKILVLTIIKMNEELCILHDIKN